MTGSTTVTIAAVNDAPVLTASSTLSYTENQAAGVINGAVTVADVDSTALASASVAITGNYQAGQDVLAFVNDNNATFGNISATFNAGDAELGGCYRDGHG